MTKLLFVSGATGGHVYPAIALAQSMDANFSFFTTPNREDCNIVSRYGFLYKPYLTASKNPISVIRAVVMIFLSCLFNRPRLMVVTGGGTTVTAIVVAILLQIPYVLCEQNVFPGRVTRLFSKFAKKVLISFEETFSYLSGGNIVCTGNPVRQAYLKDEAMLSMVSQLDRSLKTILIVGGSQGASFINDFFISNSHVLLKKKLNIILVTGSRYYTAKNFEGRLHVKKSEGAALFLVLSYTEAMDVLYECSDLVISRAGATSVSELIAFNKPALLIPYPYSTDNHQELNAKEFVKTYPGNVCSQEDLTVEIVLEFLSEKKRTSHSDLNGSQAVDRTKKELMSLIS